MSAIADCGQANSNAELLCVYYLDADPGARAAIGRLASFRAVRWEEAGAATGSSNVLVVTSEKTLACCPEVIRAGSVQVVALADTSFDDPSLDAIVFAYLPTDVRAPLLQRAIESAMADAQRRALNEQLTRRLEVANAEIEELDRVGVALSSEHESSKLLDLILTKARQITAADAGSIYLVENGTHLLDADSRTAIRPVNTNSKNNVLRFAWAQNDSIALPFRERLIEVNDSSIAGHVALTGECVHLDDAYNPPPGLCYAINRSFDAHIGYRTKSILAVPMRDEKDEVVGVLQLMNSKRDAAIKLASVSVAAGEVVPFTDHHRDLILSIASQAAVALQNAKLLASIENLFEGFVRAAVVAIEQRDPTTCGHSERVAQMTLALAEEVNNASSGRFANVEFTAAQMKELRYAALLHDFGKVGVREGVLLKAQKLFPMQLELLRQRFQFAKRTAEVESLRAQLRAALESGRDDSRQARQDAELQFQQYWKELDLLWNAVMQSNLPTIHSEAIGDQIAAAADAAYVDLDGVVQPLIPEKEVRLLSIPKGSLDPGERSEMEAHVLHTVRFLAQIPWTADVHDVTAIAGGHHEKLDGSGYPHGLLAPEIPVQTRMMTIADIFDGLTAADRPYKKAVSPEGALAILRSEVSAGAIDPDLFELFSDLVHRGVVQTGEMREQSPAVCDRSAIA